MKSLVQSFGERNFGQAELGDKRRNKCLVRIVDEMVRRPGGTLPSKLRATTSLRSLYRLMNCGQVTHEVLIKSHRAATLDQISRLESDVLVIHDATELDYSTHRSLEDLGQIGNGSRRGFIAHNSLAVDPNTGEALGLLNQVLHRRCKVPKRESVTAKRNRESRESRLWLRGTDPLPGSWRLIDVCDQGADTFEFLEHEIRSGRRFLIRAAYNRGIYVGHDDIESCETSYLRSYARTLSAAGHWQLMVASKTATRSPKKKGKKKLQKRKKREANMAVSFAPVQIKSPSTRNGEHGDAPLPLWIVRVWEIDPPENEERLEWFLMTNQPVRTFEDAYRVVGWYEKRWVIEEFHKAMKTGCGIEKMQFTNESRLEPAIALISVVSLTLLRLRDIGRSPNAKTRKASEVISEDYVAILSTWRHGKPHLDWTVHDFYYALGRLGGHQNRKGDHPPGWQILWRGWVELQAMLCGADVASAMKKCG